MKEQRQGVNPPPPSASTWTAADRGRLAVLAGAFAAVAAAVFAATSPEAATDVGPAACPAIGNTCPDGTIYAGHSPGTGKLMFAMPADAPLTMPWADAMAYAESSDALGHADWRLPAVGELGALFQNRAEIGGFRAGRSLQQARYWSSTAHRSFANFAWGVSFADGFSFPETDYFLKSGKSAVRLVRSGP